MLRICLLTYKNIVGNFAIDWIVGHFRSCYANFVPESIRIAIMVRINGCENVFHNELSYYKTGFSTLTYRRGYETLFGKRRRTSAAVDCSHFTLLLHPVR